MPNRYEAGRPSRLTCQSVRGRPCSVASSATAASATSLDWVAGLAVAAREDAVLAHEERPADAPSKAKELSRTAREESVERKAGIETSRGWGREDTC